MIQLCSTTLQAGFVRKTQKKRFRLTFKIKKYLDYLFSLQRYGIKLGLEHTYSLLKYLENFLVEIIVAT